MLNYNKYVDYLLIKIHLYVVVINLVNFLNVSLLFVNNKDLNLLKFLIQIVLMNLMEWLLTIKIVVLIYP